MNAQKKLLVIAGGAYMYGAEKVTLDVMEGLRGKDYEIEAVISGWGDGRFAAALDKLNIRYHKLKLGWYYMSKIGWSLDSLVHYPGAVWRFLRIRKRVKDWPVYVISYRQVILLWPFFRKNIVYHVHDMISNNRQARYFFKRIDSKVSCYIAVSEFIRSDLVVAGISPDKIEVIHNAVKLTHFPERYYKEKINLTIGIAGQVIERKGHVVLLKAMNLLIEKGLHVKLIITGNGDEQFKEKLVALSNEYKLNDKIVWRGFKKELADIYEGMDVLVAPTLSPEPFGLITIEANMFGIPVIATNRGGFKETVVNEVTGFLTEPSNAAELADKIEYFYKNREKIAEFGKKGREFVSENFSQEKMVTKIDKLVISV